MELKTTDLCDNYARVIQVADPILHDYGKRLAFSGPISTIKVFEDNSLVRAALEEAGNGRVLVVDGGGSLRCALLGDQLAALGAKNNWAGVVVYGCIRDSAAIAKINLGVKGLATHPLRSVKRGVGERDVLVKFAGIIFRPGHFLYADEDGLLVAEDPLL